jgi:hypothetical protein
MLDPHECDPGARDGIGREEGGVEDVDARIDDPDEHILALGPCPVL